MQRNPVKTLTARLIQILFQLATRQTRDVAAVERGNNQGLRLRPVREYPQAFSLENQNLNLTNEVQDHHMQMMKSASIPTVSKRVTWKQQKLQLQLEDGNGLEGK